MVSYISLLRTVSQNLQVSCRVFPQMEIPGEVLLHNLHHCLLYAGISLSIENYWSSEAFFLKGL